MKINEFIISGILINSWINTVILFLTCIFLGFSYYKYKFSHWKKQGIFYAAGKFPFGSISDFILAKKSVSETFSDLYFKGKGHKYLGYYTFVTPAVLIRDLEIVKNVLVKDFDNFSDRGMYFNEKKDPLSAHLFALRGLKWKFLRSKMTPTFTSGKLKNMFEIMKMCSEQLKDYMIEITDKSDDPIDFKQLISRNSLNIIANTAVGIEGQGIKDDSEFSTVAFKVTEPNFVQACRFILPMISKDIAKLLRLRFTPKKVENCYLALTKNILEYRLKNNVKRNDFFQILMEQYNDSTPGKSDRDRFLTFNDLAAGTFVFILAGYETTAATICFSLYELAMNKDIQEQLIREVDSAGDNVTYEQIQGLKYLEMVLKETWRKYPPAGILFRESKHKYKLDDGVYLEKGMTVTIPVLGIHRDPEYFPDPEKFDPERFNKENPCHEVKPFSFLPFGEGPRYCIGKRYAYILTKLTLFTIISQFRIELSNKTQVPPTFDPKIFVNHAKKGMFLRVINRKN